MSKRSPDVSNVTLLVDADDTIENLLPAWVAELNKISAKKVSPDDITEWDISRFFPELTPDEVFGILRSPEFWKKVTPKKDAKKFLKRLYDRGCEIFVCTNSNYETIKEKYEFVIKKHFPFIDWDHVIVCKEKQMINADFLIDDAPHNLVGGTYHKILFSAPHNKKYDAEGNGIKRVNNWEEIYDIVDNYAACLA